MQSIILAVVSSVDDRLHPVRFGSQSQLPDYLFCVSSVPPALYPS